VRARAWDGLKAAVSTQVPSLPTRNEWGESWRGGDLNKTHAALLSRTLSSFLRQEAKEEPSAIEYFSTCADTNWLKARVRVRGADKMGPPGEGTRPTRWRFCGGCRPRVLTRRGVTWPMRIADSGVTVGCSPGSVRDRQRRHEPKNGS